MPRHCLARHPIGTTLTAEPILQLHATLGEGALWDPRQQVLYWVNILGKKSTTEYELTPNELV